MDARTTRASLARKGYLARIGEALGVEPGRAAEVRAAFCGTAEEGERIALAVSAGFPVQRYSFGPGAAPSRMAMDGDVVVFHSRVDGPSEFRGDVTEVVIGEGCQDLPGLAREVAALMSRGVFFAVTSASGLDAAMVGADYALLPPLKSYVPWERVHVLVAAPACVAQV